MLAALIMLYCIMTTNFINTVQTLASGSGSAYAASWKQRHAYIAENFGKDIVVSSLLLYPFPINAFGDAIPDSKDHWFANATPTFFHVNSILSEAPSKDSALLRLDKDQIKYPYVTRLISNNDNFTFQHNWLALDNKVQTEQYHVLVYLQGPTPDFLTGVFREKINRALESRETLQHDNWIVFFGISQVIDLQHWKLSNAEQLTHLFPVAAKEWGQVKAVYGSSDGVTYERVLLVE